jgi:hypothetical protein
MLRHTCGHTLLPQMKQQAKFKNFQPGFRLSLRSR